MAMAAGLLAGQLINTLPGMIAEATGRFDVLREIKGLQDKLLMIRAFMADAERGIENEAINLWVRQLKDVMYHADDVIDLCRLEFLRQMPSVDQPAPAPPVRCPQSFILSCFTRVRRYEIFSSIRDINHRLEEISRLGDQFHLRAVDPKVEDADVTRRTSSILSSDVVGIGIEEDATDMIGRLLKEDKRPGNKIFAITGMGGIGKTTLAQKIYSDYTIKNHFEIRIWVSVSRYFSETDLLRSTINFIRGESSIYSAHSKQQLQEILSTAIQGKRFFLVLDDVWSTEAWEHVLRYPFQGGDPGSRIILTTRDEHVAQRMGAVLHRVTPLSNEDSWTLLCKMAFMDEDDVKDIDRLRDIGLKIVKKCEGLPLALKFAGETLRTKQRSQREWDKVFGSLTSFKNRFNKEFMGALYLSYEALPSHLRPCFLYCSLFLENRIIARRELVQLWIAEGFVKSHPDSTLEEVAEDYCAQIAAYSLLRLEVDDKEADAGCRMHDVLRDLALNLAEDDSYAGDLENLPVPEVKLRRLSIAEKISSPTAITKHKFLRALLIFDSPLADEALRDLLHQLSHLRVLDLRGTEIKEVPSSLGKLLHLRYLNLSRTRIRALPSSIKELRYLQFLNLNGCKNLKHLPTGIIHLHNLRNLDLLHTEVDQIPSGVGRIKNLNTLLGYAISRGDPALEELKNLNQLRDLNIRKLERAKSNNISPLQDKNQLRSLVLSCHHPAANSSLMRVPAIFDDLRPPVCLEQLTIECYFGTEFPIWMCSPSNCANLVQLNLKSCTFCRKLPSLGQLPQLKFLCISASLEIVSIDTEFFGESRHSFPKLERLVIQDMPKWEEWQGPESGALPLLKQMYLSKCPKLRSLPRCLQYSTALTQLVIEAADSIRAIEGLASVTQLRLDDCPNLEKISFLPALKTLQIIKCPLLEVVRDVQALQHLVLEDFTLESLPKWFTSNNLTKLDTLDVTGNRDFLMRLQPDGADWHKIAYIPRVNARLHSPKDSTYFAYSKDPFSFYLTVTETTKHDKRDLESSEITHLGRTVTETTKQGSGDPESSEITHLDD